MSWNFSKVGIASNTAALKAAIQAESAPKVVKEALCKSVDDALRNMTGNANIDPSKVAIVVSTYGHLNGVDSGTGEITDATAIFYGNEKIKLRVFAAPLINTPLEA